MTESAFGASARRAPTQCPCGGRPRPGAAYVECCGRLHEGAAAPTAEALMRSRYSAFAVGDAGYLLRTWHARTRPATLSLERGGTWTGLEVLDTVGGGPEDATGVVTYRAHRRDEEGDSVLTETARFVRRGGRWVYVDGDVG